MAASFLGLEVVKNLVLSLGVFKAFENLPAIAEFSLEEMQAHSRLTAAIAQRLGLSKEAQDAAVVASLLHDIGKLVLAYKMPNRFARLLASAKSEQRPLYRIEEELWGITHAEVGAYLLGLWGLPIQVTEAIAYHHTPSAVPHRGFDAISAVYIANLLAHESDLVLVHLRQPGPGRRGRARLRPGRRIRRLAAAHAARRHRRRPGGILTLLLLAAQWVVQALTPASKTTPARTSPPRPAAGSSAPGAGVPVPTTRPASTGRCRSSCSPSCSPSPATALASGWHATRTRAV